MTGRALQASGSREGGGGAGRIRCFRAAAFLALLLLAAIPRGVYLSELLTQPRVDEPRLDAALQLAWAQAEASGDWLRFPPGLERLVSLPRDPYLHAPGYPLWVAGFLRMGLSPVGMLAVQQLLGLLVVALLWWAARRWVSPRSGWFVGVLAALHWSGMYYAGEFLDASLLTTLLLLVLVAAGLMAECIVSRWEKEPEQAWRPTRCMAGWAVLAGLALGGVLITRPAARLVLPVVVFWILWVAWRRQNPSLRATAIARMGANLPPDRQVDASSDVLLASLEPPRMIRWMAAIRALPGACRLAGPAWIGLLAGVVLVVTPVLWRNAKLGGLGAPVAVGDSVAALVASLPEHDGFDDDDLGMGTRLDRVCDYRQLAEVAGSDAARDIVRHFRRQRRALFLHDPEGVGRTLARRIQLFWGPRDVGSSRVVEHDRAASAILRRLPVPFALLSALGIFGIAQWLIARRDRSDVAPSEIAPRVVMFAMPLLVVGSLAAWMAGHLPFLASGLWRQPMVPYLLFLSAWAFEDFCFSLSSRRWGEAGRWCLILVFLVLATSQNVGGYVPNRAKWLLDQGLALAANGQADAALVAYRTVLMATPGIVDPESGVRLADSSLTNPRDVRRHQKAAAVACIKLGNAAAQRRDPRLAVRYFHLAANLEPKQAEALINAGKVMLATGWVVQAEKALSEAIRRDPRAWPAYHPLAQSLYRQGRYAEALAWLDRLLEFKPDHSPAQRLRALLHTEP